MRRFIIIPIPNKCIIYTVIGDLSKSPWDKPLVMIRGNKTPSPLVGRLVHGHICNTIVSIISHLTVPNVSVPSQYRSDALPISPKIKHLEVSLTDVHSQYRKAFLGQLLFYSKH